MTHITYVTKVRQALLMPSEVEMPKWV